MKTIAAFLLLCLTTVTAFGFPIPITSIDPSLAAIEACVYDRLEPAYEEAIAREPLIMKEFNARTILDFAHHLPRPFQDVLASTGRVVGGGKIPETYAFSVDSYRDLERLYRSESSHAFYEKLKVDVCGDYEETALFMNTAVNWFIDFNSGRDVIQNGRPVSNWPSKGVYKVDGTLSSLMAKMGLPRTNASFMRMVTAMVLSGQDKAADQVISVYVCLGGKSIKAPDANTDCLNLSQ